MSTPEVWIREVVGLLPPDTVFRTLHTNRTGVVRDQRGEGTLVFLDALRLGQGDLFGSPAETVELAPETEVLVEREANLATMPAWFSAE